MQPQQTTDAAEALDAGAVLRFLTANPGFFDQHQDVLPGLRIPHVSGRAVSLIERQVSALRGKCSTLEHDLRDLIGVARANERLQGRVHALVREIVSASSLDVLVAVTRESLVESFGADAVHVSLVLPPGPAPPDAAGDGGADIDLGGSDVVDAGSEARDEAAATRGEGTPAILEGRPDRRLVAADDSRLDCFRELFEKGSTRCGLPTAAQLALMVGDDRADIGSAALIPLSHEGTLGVVMLASRDESRFAAGKGVVFLDQLGEVLSRRVHALARRPEQPIGRTPS